MLKKVIEKMLNKNTIDLVNKHKSIGYSNIVPFTLLNVSGIFENIYAYNILLSDKLHNNDNTRRYINMFDGITFISLLLTDYDTDLIKRANYNAKEVFNNYYKGKTLEEITVQTIINNILSSPLEYKDYNISTIYLLSCKNLKELESYLYGVGCKEIKQTDDRNIYFNMLQINNYVDDYSKGITFIITELSKICNLNGIHKALIFDEDNESFDDFDKIEDIVKDMFLLIYLWFEDFDSIYIKDCECLQRMK